MPHSFTLKLTIALIAGFALGCSSQSAPPPQSDAGQVRPLSAGETKLVSSGESFGLQLFQNAIAANPDQNIVISPLSIAMALAMVYNGAEGTTREAMRQTLQLYGLTDPEMNGAYQTLMGLLTHLDSAVVASVANSIWFRQGFPVKEPFLEVNREFFDARAEELDFASGHAAPVINAWVAEKTRNRITSIVEPPIDPQLMMLLVNAVYFKGTWTHSFDTTATRLLRPFTLPDGNRIEVDFMKVDADFDHTRDNFLQAVDLPYGNGDFSMTLILPEPGVSVDSVIGMLTVERWNSLVADLNSGSGHVFLPRFTVTCKLTLNDVLANLGMAAAFSPSRANFSGISDAENLHISEVLHKTYVAVDEHGTEAAAVTGIGIRVTAISPNEFTMTFDRPFLFAIRERNTRSLLFLGRVADPTAD